MSEAVNQIAESGFRQAMWQDLSENSTPPKALAHYTSLTTLELILKSSEIWFSNPLYMNDWEELRFGMHAGAIVFRSSEALRDACGTDEAHASLLSSFDKLFAEFDSTHALDVYVLCLAEHDPNNIDGVLSMWRGYGAQGGGSALVIDPLKSSFITPLPLLTDKVVYASHDERIAWLTSKAEVLASEIVKHERSPHNLFAAAHFWFERLKLFALFTKHRDFPKKKSGGLSIQSNVTARISFRICWDTPFLTREYNQNSS